MAMAKAKAMAKDLAEDTAMGKGKGHGQRQHRSDADKLPRRSLQHFSGLSFQARFNPGEADDQASLFYALQQHKHSTDQEPLRHRPKHVWQSSPPTMNPAGRANPASQDQC
mgnify:CR=1 FL=1